MSLVGIPAKPSAAAHVTSPWPYRELDIVGLRDRGWRPSPFRDVVLKVHQRCNLACDYCYVYTMADQTWRDRPPAMTATVWRAAARRIAEHAAAHQLAHIRVILHGGEPLLAGLGRLRSIVAAVRAELPSDCRPEFCLQTNGLLLDEETLRALRAESVAVGVSLDGGRETNDRHRRRANGAGSFEGVHRALRLLGDDRYRSSFAGLLCTVDLDADPVACYEALLAYRPPGLDFLLPHANWSNPPRARSDAATTPYGDWLVTVFDRWYGAPAQETRIRLFEDVISLVLGGASRSEQVGLSPVGVVVIESDGAIELVDSLKSAYAGACATGLTVFADPLDAALAHPGVVARQIGRHALCDTCLACPIHRVCGAGHYAHRYRAGEGFHNPSVYCADLRRLITHVQ
ncbi:MAG TPA: FxsB family cyclophane-forming radical SAM/SPASM peptide maturase, partial [Pilimelia sp.]|nr:FxsB family cyclophane-forming radical SAM/SPASM peptide maturase [Pilimelia sp.]